MWRTPLASALAIALGATALAGATDDFRAFTTETARRIAVARDPALIPDALLETNTGERMALHDFRGRWLLVDFIYTRCASICSAQGASFARMKARLADPIARGRLQLLSISFDPAHDTPAALASYLERSGDRGPGWISARPVDRDTLARLLTGFGVTVIADGEGGYVHNDGVQIVDPQGRIVAIVDGEDPGAIEHALLQRLAS